ncbi:hypothetical protein [Kribbella caucasensis]|uniref:hypothetical protein n=1 Tax=Kribbella caucasensis TaxID=2512215 RepID=UPI00105BFF84|nr:hypothetical protein [Kribbella sp. VKM Ac-2527]
MGTTSGKGRGAPTPAVVGIARSMRARDVSRPRKEQRPRQPTDSGQTPGGQTAGGQEAGGQEAGGSGGSSPVSS